MNEVILIGRVGNKPEITDTKNGTKVATISIPLYHSYSPEDKETEWVQCQAYGKLANIVELAEKGVLVAVRGELNNPRWKDEQGKWKNRPFLKIEEFRFLERKKESSGVNVQSNTDNQMNKTPQNDSSNQGAGTLNADDIDSFLENL